MAWLGLDKLFLGVDLSAEQDRSKNLDQQISQKNQQLADAGFLTQAQADAANADIAQTSANTGMNDVVGSVDTEFAAGIQEGLNNVLNAPGKVVGAVGNASSTLLGGILKAIPWWVYLGLAVALFVWMGGLELLRGKLGRR
jgi:hypothetical protein